MPIRIRLRYPDVETFVEKFAPNVTRGGVFLASRNIQPVGADVAFEIQLAAGEVVLAGQGRVSWVKEHNPAEPNRPYGMGVQFLSLAAASKPILARLLRAKEAAGQGRRTTTGPLTPLGATGSGPHLSGPWAAPGGNGVTHGHLVTAPPAPIDTSVDLAAEYGLDEQKVRRLVERTWMMGARSSDDLADLLKPEPVEPATLAQALAELPRLLDPQYSRRRASSGFRPLGAKSTVSGAVTGEIAESSSARGPHQTEGQVLARASGSDSGEASESTDVGDPADELSSPQSMPDDEDARAEITEEREAEQSMQAVSAVRAEPPPVMNGRGSRHGRKRR